MAFDVQKGGREMPAQEQETTEMTKNRTGLVMLALAAVTGATLSTAALADRMGDGPMGMPGMDGPMGMEGPGFGLGKIDFAAVDTDKDGKITAAEMEAYRAAEVAGVDADKDGKLSATELSAMHMARMQAMADDMAAKMVERLDADGDGLLTAAEMMARPVPDRMFGMADADGDGALTQEEIDAARAQMAEMRQGRGPGGRGDGEGRGHGRWFFDNDN